MKKLKSKIEIWCTLGPSSLNKKVIKRLTETGIAMFRINLSHTKVEDIEKTVNLIKSYTDIPVCLDTEGPQIRNGQMKKQGSFFKEQSIVRIVGRDVIGDAKCFSLRPDEIISELEVGDLISVDFDSVLISVIKINKRYVEAKVICSGKVCSNKAVTVNKKIDLSFLTQKDKCAIDIVKKLNLKQISLSFVRKKEDIDIVRSMVGSDVRIISKIETNDALHNLSEIIEHSDAILIDRGDLSREEPINKIPLLQKSIIKEANKQKVPVFVATNLLESMVKTKKPLRSEVNDIMNTLLDGADGLVLAAETAIGDFPVECANMIKRMIKYYQIAAKGYSFQEILRNDSFLLVEPHGGTLIQKYNSHANWNEINKMPKIVVDEKAIINAEQIGIGTYSPLKGFMTRDELYDVLDNYRLPDGIAWTLPITLQVSRSTFCKFKKGDTVALQFKKDRLIYAVLNIEDIFKVNIREVAKKWFGTDDKEHPGVEQLFKSGEYFVGGEIELVRRRETRFKEYEFTPQQTRIIFEHKEWSKVAAFHTRNVIHRAHEYLQMSALERYHLDGLLLHPIIGPKKPNDFKPDVILKSYQLMIDHFYPKDKVVLGAFSAYSHYAGPREAVFTALCRKNFGCSHFILGRDHTGVKNYYISDESHRLFDKLGDIGITPIFFSTVYYCKKCKTHVEKCSHGQKESLHISGTQIRRMFLEGCQPPAWVLRKRISSFILDKLSRSQKVFVS